MKKKYLAGLVALTLAVGLFALVLPVEAQTWVRTIVGSVKFKGPVLFEQEVTMSGNTGSIAGADVTASDDVAAGDDLTVADDATITGTLTTTAGFSNGSNLSTAANGSRIYTGTTTLTEAGGVETILTVTNATTQATSGTLTYHIRGTDATDYQSTTGTVIFTLVNKAGTVTSSILPATIAAGITQESATQALSSGTMTGAFDSVEAANATAITLNIDSSLTLTAISMEWVLVLQGPGTVS